MVGAGEDGFGEFEGYVVISVLYGDVVGEGVAVSLGVVEGVIRGVGDSFGVGIGGAAGEIGVGGIGSVCGGVLRTAGVEKRRGCGGGSWGWGGGGCG